VVDVSPAGGGAKQQKGFGMGGGSGGGRPSGRGLGLALLVAGALSACSPMYRYHGYIPSESELAALVVGQTTREEVIALVGAPTAKGLIDGDAFYYVRSRFRDYGYRASREVEREVLVISFAPSGQVANVERFGLEDGNVVALSRRVTDDNLRDTTFIRQLLGNVGQFDAGQLLGEG
jgi:outer membrane protein assembly factor BamE (lipoprotein component of BamABCDE complex)